MNKPWLLSFAISSAMSSLLAARSSLRSGIASDSASSRTYPPIGPKPLPILTLSRRSANSSSVIWPFSSCFSSSLCSFWSFLSIFFLSFSERSPFWPSSASSTVLPSASSRTWPPIGPKPLPILTLSRRSANSSSVI